ncbi:MAG: 5'/3'-nucleotidase SurE [Chloroflexi bacterium]|nr:5'/3'-nucleotidase SurE [Chloroflexota bacterium]
MTKDKPQILLTNDDGFDSPGLWAAAEALSEIGFVWVTAPRDQASGMGRSMPSTSDGRIATRKMEVHGKEWTVYAVGGTPAQTVQHAVLEIMPEKPDLVVSGINYGSNMGIGVTISGTVGAALEGAAYKIPSIAVSLDTADEYHLSHSDEIDFEPAAQITVKFASRYLQSQMPDDVQAFKIEVPADATAETPWQISSLSREQFYISTAPQRESWDEEITTGYRVADDLSVFPEGSDVHTVHHKGLVAVTPLSLDLTSRVDLKALEKQLHATGN